MVSAEVDFFLIRPEKFGAALQNDKDMILVHMRVQAVLAAGGIYLETDRKVFRRRQHGVRAALVQHLRLQTERGDFIVLRRGDLILENVFGRH